MKALGWIVGAEVVLLSGLAVYSYWPKPVHYVRARELTPIEQAEAQAGADREYRRMLARLPRPRPRIHLAAHRAKAAPVDPRERRIEDAAWGEEPEEIDTSPRPTARVKPFPKPFTPEQAEQYREWIASMHPRRAPQRVVYRIVQGKPRPIAVYSEGPSNYSRDEQARAQRYFQEQFYLKANARFGHPNQSFFMPPPASVFRPMRHR